MQRPYPSPDMYGSRSFIALRYAMTVVSNARSILTWCFSLVLSVRT